MGSKWSHNSFSMSSLWKTEFLLTLWQLCGSDNEQITSCNLRLCVPKPKYKQMQIDNILLKIVPLLYI